MENNLSETAFTIPAEDGEADYELRWFTPDRRGRLCGHATLGQRPCPDRRPRPHPLPHPQGRHARGRARRRRLCHVAAGLEAGAEAAAGDRSRRWAARRSRRSGIPGRYGLDRAWTARRRSARWRPISRALAAGRRPADHRHRARRRDRRGQPRLRPRRRRRRGSGHRLGPRVMVPYWAGRLGAATP